MLITNPCPATLTGEKGAYALVIQLANNLPIALPRRPPTMLPTGRYVYCGSAYGPGGLAGRVRRHLRQDRSQRWHVDRLTAVGTVIALGLAPGGSECALLSQIQELPGVELPIPGFGSSDCRLCPAHLAHLPDGLDLSVLGAAFT